MFVHCAVSSMCNAFQMIAAHIGNATPLEMCSCTPSGVSTSWSYVASSQIEFYRLPELCILNYCFIKRGLLYIQLWEFQTSIFADQLLCQMYQVCGVLKLVQFVIYLLREALQCCLKGGYR